MSNVAPPMVNILGFFMRLFLLYVLIGFESVKMMLRSVKVVHNLSIVKLLNVKIIWSVH